LASRKGGEKKPPASPLVGFRGVRPEGKGKRIKKGRGRSGDKRGARSTRRSEKKRERAVPSVGQSSETGEADLRGGKKNKGRTPDLVPRPRYDQEAKEKKKPRGFLGLQKKRGYGAKNVQGEEKEKKEAGPAFKKRKRKTAVSRGQVQKQRSWPPRPGKKNKEKGEGKPSSGKIKKSSRGGEKKKRGEKHVTTGPSRGEKGKREKGPTLFVRIKVKFLSICGKIGSRKKEEKKKKNRDLGVGRRWGGVRCVLLLQTRQELLHGPPGWGKKKEGGNLLLSEG